MQPQASPNKQKLSLDNSLPHVKQELKAANSTLQDTCHQAIPNW